MKKTKALLITILSLFLFNSVFAQLLEDNFEGNSTITTWFGDGCNFEEPFSNPHQKGINTSANVLRYEDTGGAYANIGFNAASNIRLAENNPFTLKIYVPSSGLTGNQPNQISLKLQNNTIGSPWETQCEIIKSLQLDVWQEVVFDFATDAYINFDPTSPDPLTRNDFNRVLIQINGENNTDHVLAYIDDFHFEGDASVVNDPVYDVLVWSDEFETNGAINSEKWFHQTQIPSGGSWYNGEVQHYTDRVENSFVENGILHIVAKKETFTDQGVTKNYTSARLNSKFAFTYGRVEVKAKLPSGVGTWPAIWMLGKNITEAGSYWQTKGFGTTSWPACGEIDIMEHWGDNQNFVQSAMHTPSSSGSTVNHGGQTISTVSTDFHVYALEWYEDRMVFSVDDVVHYVYQPSDQNEDTWPFNKDQFLLLNIAVQASIPASFTQSSMEIDYVRVYQKSTGVSTKDTKHAEIKFFPNPVDGICMLQIPEELIGSHVDIYNIHGRFMDGFRIAESNHQINPSGWSAGVYLLKQDAAQFSKTYKLIKR
jgi:beta-glucanase (GH16 family)